MAQLIALDCGEAGQNLRLSAGRSHLGRRKPILVQSLRLWRLLRPFDQAVRSDEKRLNLGQLVLPMSKSTLPNYQYAPAQAKQSTHVSMIAINVTGQLSAPEVRSRSRTGSINALLMLVPETAMHKNGDPILWKYYVRFPREIFPVKPKSVSPGVQVAAYLYLRGCIFSPDACHHPGTCLLADNVYHVAAERREPSESVIRLVLSYSSSMRRQEARNWFLFFDTHPFPLHF